MDRFVKPSVPRERLPYDSKVPCCRRQNVALWREMKQLRKF